MLKNKSETCSTIIQFITFIEKQTNCNVKAIQTDGGGEFKPLTKFFIQKGIRHRLTCPHTSEQNGLVERKHRHIVETGLTLLSQGALPMKYWNEAFNTSVYLINKLPTKVLNNRTPHEMIFN